MTTHSKEADLVTSHNQEKSLVTLITYAVKSMLSKWGTIISFQAFLSKKRVPIARQQPGFLDFFFFNQTE